MSLLLQDRVFTGDALLIGGTGRTDLPTGDSGALYDSLFGRLLQLDPSLKVYPAHEHKGRSHSTIGAEIAANPRLQAHDKTAFIEIMSHLNQDFPDPTKRIVRCCEFGRISTQASATSREMGFMRVMALHGGMKAWRESGYPMGR